MKVMESVIFMTMTTAICLFIKKNQTIKFEPLICNHLDDRSNPFLGKHIFFFTSRSWGSHS